MTNGAPIEAAELIPAVKWRQLGLLSFAELLAMTLWFSASAVVPQLTVEWNLTGAQQAWMTISVQLGFVIGALISSLLTLSDRISSQKLFAVCAVMGAIFNGLIAIADAGIYAALILRFLTGLVLAGVYPPGMKLVATWCRSDRGLGIGILVGALTVGSAVPHLVNGLNLFGTGGFPPWRVVLFITSAQALLAAFTVGLFFHEGPYRTAAAPFEWRFAFAALKHRPTRLANFGYLGHMWELYAMWTWAPLLLIQSYNHAGFGVQPARFAGFATVAIGGLGCVMAGQLADRLGRSRITIWSLTISGACALIAGFFFASPVILTIICLIWGFAVVADSAQYSAAVTELTDPRYIGTALTVQTSLGFLLTIITIRLIPYLIDLLAWEYVFSILAIGPALGIWSMARLRGDPEAAKMASGKR